MFYTEDQVKFNQNISFTIVEQPFLKKPNKDIDPSQFTEFLDLIINGFFGAIRSSHTKEKLVLGFFKNLLQSNIELVNFINDNEELNLSEISDEQLFIYLGLDPHTEMDGLADSCLNRNCMMEIMIKAGIKSLNKPEEFKTFLECLKKLMEENKIIDKQREKCDIEKNDKD
jgi:hypothetical protein